MCRYFDKDTQGVIIIIIISIRRRELVTIIPRNAVEYSALLRSIMHQETNRFLSVRRRHSIGVALCVRSCFFDGVEEPESIIIGRSSVHGPVGSLAWADRTSERLFFPFSLVSIPPAL